jgi:hypothetical protein
LRYFLITFKRKAGGQIDEEVSIARNLKPSDITMCNVIMDFKQRKVERCFIEGKVLDTDWDKLREYYHKVYPSIIENLDNANRVEGE